jgi:hypothetical protein
MEPMNQAPEEGSFQADVVDFRAAQAKKQAELIGVDASRARLDALAAEYQLPRAEDGVHISTEVLTDQSGRRLDPETLREIMAAEEAYDAARQAEEPLPPAVGE